MANELMIWVDNYNQTPGGNKVASNVMLGGRTFDVWWHSSSGYVVFYASATFTSGTVDILQIFNYAIQQSWLPPTSTLGQINLGVEISSTSGQDATWYFNDFSITAN
jgi:Glycosyl hydrolase family 12